MIAAVYARKSTEQAGVADEQKSVARQIEHARAYAVGKGWTVADEYVFVDDGISGAEFAGRPGFVRLMAALKPRPPFQVLVMSEESRLGREAIETAYALKQLVTGGVRVFFYLEDRERTLDSPTDKIMLSLATFADELEREKVRQRTYDTMARKAKAGHVTGGACFGYTNVRVMTAAGERSHVAYQVNEPEADVVRQIFTLCSRGLGLKRIAKRLNEAHAVAPRRRGRPAAWAPSSVREALQRELYRGRRVWNVTRKRDSWGQDRRKTRPEAEWFMIDMPELRIVPDALWRAAHAQLEARATIYRQWCEAGKPGGGLRDGRDVRAKYFLSGFGQCSCCGGSMQAVSSTGGSKRRIRRYACSMYWNRGTTVCTNRRMAKMDAADTAIAELLRREVLLPARLERAIERAVRMIQDEHTVRDRRGELERKLAAVERELANLADAVAANGAVPAILKAVAKRERDRQQLRSDLDACASAPVPLVPNDVLRRRLRGFLKAWALALDGNRAEARQLLDVALGGRIRFEPVSEGGYLLHVPIAFDKVLTAVVPELGAAVPNEGMTRAGIEPATL